MPEHKGEVMKTQLNGLSLNNNKATNALYACRMLNDLNRSEKIAQKCRGAILFS